MLELAGQDHRAGVPPQHSSQLDHTAHHCEQCKRCTADLQAGCCIMQAGCTLNLLRPHLSSNTGLRLCRKSTLPRSVTRWMAGPTEIFSLLQAGSVMVSASRGDEKGFNTSLVGANSCGGNCELWVTGRYV